MIQSFVNLQHLKVIEEENLNEFLRQLGSCIQVAVVPNEQRNRYFHLHLKGDVLTFFNQQEAAVRDDYDQAVAALRNIYTNDPKTQRQKLLLAQNEILRKVLRTYSQSYNDWLLKPTPTL